MNLSDLFSAPTRPAWTARLVVYIAFIVTLSVTLQILTWLLW